MHIQRIRLKNFKAFKDEEVLEVDGKNLLICGNNGSGKSSLHYALHVFFQSSIKGEAFKKYFTDPKDKVNGTESLLNIYGDPADYTLELSVKKNDRTTVKYQIKPAIDTGAENHQHADIKSSDFASDFISHRLLVNFYNFRNSQDANIWFLFEKEVFPYWNDDTLTISYDQWLFNLKKEFYELYQQTESVVDESGTGQKVIKKFSRESAEYKAFQKKIDDFNKAFFGFYSSLLPGVNVILDKFLTDEKIEVNIEYKTPLDADIGNGLWNQPELILKVKQNGTDISKPHVFLNEARLTALALSIRLAMFDKKFKGTGGDVIKLLVLDDLLVSLDMSFRMKLVKYLQITDSFKGYQVFMLTHDKGLFEVLQQTLAEDESKWKCFEFFETNTFPITNPGDYKNPLIVEKKDVLLLADEYLRGKSKDKNGKEVPVPKDYELCALYLRKKSEQLIKRFYDPEMDGIFRYRVLKDLANGISGLKSEYIHQAYSKIETILSNGEIDEAKIKKLIDLNFNNTTLTPEETSTNNKLNAFKKQVLELVSYYYKADTNFKNQKRELERLSKEMNLLRSRIMNKGAHHDDSPIFELELRGAIDKLKEFESVILKIK